MYYSDSRRDSDEGRELEGKYILSGVRGTLQLARIIDALPVPTSAKDIHWIPSFLQPPTDSQGNGRYIPLCLL